MILSIGNSTTTTSTPQNRREQSQQHREILLTVSKTTVSITLYFFSLFDSGGCRGPFIVANTAVCHAEARQFAHRSGAQISNKHNVYSPSTCEYSVLCAAKVNIKTAHDITNSPVNMS